MKFNLTPLESIVFFLVRLAIDILTYTSGTKQIDSRKQLSYNVLGLDHWQNSSGPERGGSGVEVVHQQISYQGYPGPGLRAYSWLQDGIY
jgi:hypothetical protein